LGIPKNADTSIPQWKKLVSLNSLTAAGLYAAIEESSK